MVIAARRAYSDATSWMRSARVAKIAKWGFARRAFVSAFVAGLIVMGLIGLVAPANFGAPGTDTFGSGWPLPALIGVLVAAAFYVFTKRTGVRKILDRLREPWLRPLNEHEAFEGAANALAACPDLLKNRFAVTWVWGPIGWLILGTMFAFSAAYFLIDALLARFGIGWQQAIYAGTSVLLSFVAFRMAAKKLATWRFAASVYKEFTSGYPE